MRTPRLVASDVDGTLLDPWEDVHPRTASAAKRVAASETPFVLVTGRPPRWIPPVVDKLGIAGFVVCSNGAVTYDSALDLVLHTESIDPMLLHDVTMELRRAIPGCSFAVERSTSGATDRVDQQFLAEHGFRHVWPNPDLRTVPHDELVGKAAVKLLVLHENLTSAEMDRAAREVIEAQLQVTYSTGAGLLELSAPGVNKASGLAAIAAHLGVDQADVVAFGDMPNDLPMLQWAGHGVAVRNAHPAVLDVADEVTASNADQGVAQVIERWWP